MHRKDEIRTVSGLKLALTQCKQVYVQARFGISEDWIPITKAAARELIAPLNAAATPESHEMHSGIFGTLEDDRLYLG